MYIPTYVRYSFLMSLKVSTKLDDSRKGLLLIKRPIDPGDLNWFWAYLKKKVDGILKIKTNSFISIMTHSS